MSRKVLSNGPWHGAFSTYPIFSGNGKKVLASFTNDFGNPAL
jgi:hypothetical protein